MTRRRKYTGYYDDFERTRPVEVVDGIKARSQRGAFARNWWAARWIEALERLVDSGRLGRGRTYARKGQVLSIDEMKGGVTSRVQGSRRTPYKITIRVAPLTDAQWEKVIDVLAEQAIFAADLLAGQMPQDIEIAFQAAGVSLFPESSDELVTSCSCPDYANPCKHIAATHYILGERFDEDPFLLFRLRGRTQEQIMTALRQRRADRDASEEETDEPEQVIPLDELIAEFWDLRQPIDTVSVTISLPAIETPLLKRLGEAAFVPAPGIEALLLPAYRAISETSLKAAYDEGLAEQEPGGF